MEESNQYRLFSIPKSDEKTTLYIFLSKEENALIEYNSKNETNPRPVARPLAAAVRYGERRTYSI